MNAALQAQFPCQSFDLAAQWHAPVFERMGLEKKVMVLRRAFGKAAHHNFEKLGHRVERRVHLKAAVMLKLQKRQMIGKAAVANTPSGHAPLQGLKRHEQKAFEIKLEFFRDAQCTVRLEVAVLPVSKHHKPVVERAIKHMLARVPPAGRGQGCVHVRMGQPRLHLV